MMPPLSEAATVLVDAPVLRQVYRNAGAHP